jgi:hypothetical protein
MKDYIAINATVGMDLLIDVAVADKLIKKIDEISEIFWATKK